MDLALVRCCLSNNIILIYEVSGVRCHGGHEMTNDRQVCGSGMCWCGIALGSHGDRC